MLDGPRGNESAGQRLTGCCATGGTYVPSPARPRRGPGRYRFPQETAALVLPCPAVDLACEVFDFGVHHVRRLDLHPAGASSPNSRAFRSLPRWQRSIARSRRSRSTTGAPLASLTPTASSAPSTVVAAAGNAADVHRRVEIAEQPATDDQL